MFKRSHKATFLLVICIVYVFDVVLSGTMFGWMKTYAAPDPSQIISIFVDKEIAGSIGNELNWFANSYIGRNEKNAKVQLFTIDKNNISPADMVKINQNLYLEGEKTGPSRLIGTILIGDLRLPMVNKQGFIFPTIYPLVDFEKPKYYYNPKSDYFEYQSEGNSQPEIRHSVINFKNTSSEYVKYFNKLKKYSADPESRVTNNMRYEDIIHQKQTANGDNFDKYINNYVFSEDVMYNRYTNLMVDIFNALHNSGLVEVLSGYNNQVGNNLTDEYYNEPEFEELKGNYKKEIEKFRNLIKSLKKLLGDNNNGSTGPDSSDSALGTLPNSKFINTIFIQKVVDGFMKDYVELYGTSYFDSKENRLSLGGKYIGGISGAKADDHITIASKRDEVGKQLMMDVNTKLEKAIDDKIESEGYAMNVIIPTRINKEKKEIFEVYYFGLPAEQIQDASQFSIYRGTFNNIRSLGKLDKYNYGSRMDYNSKQSIGSTRGENAREVEASRGYDFSLLEYDQQEFERVKNAMPYKKHKKKRKTIDKFISYYRAGYTPLNIDPDSQDIRLNIQKMDYTQLWNPFKDRSLGGWVFNIAGSRITTDDRKIGFTLGSEDDDDGDGGDDDEDQTISNMKSYSGYSDSYFGAEFFASAIKVTRDNGKRLKIHKRRVRKGGKPRISNREDINIWNLGNGSTSDGLFLLPNGAQNNKPDQIHPEDYIVVQPKSNTKRNRYFKSVDSRFFHKSPTLEDMYGEYIQLDQVNTKAEMACEDTNEEAENDTPQVCNGYSFKFTDLYPGTVVTNLYAKRGDDYSVTGGKVFFNNSAVWYEHDQEINFDGLIGEITGGNKLYIRYDNRDVYLPWGEGTFDCEEYNTDEDELAACEGISFKINGHDIAPISEKFVDIKNDGSLIQFYSGAKILVYGKSYDLGGLSASLDKNTKVATFSGRKLQIGGINEFTMERPIDSPRYLNFQGIAGNKLTRIYPNVRKIPVFKEVGGKRQLMTIPEIEQSISDYFKNKVNIYNEDLKKEYANRFNYYSGADGGAPRSTWINKFDNFDRTISPLVQTDNTGMKLRSYQFLPDDYLLESLATSRNKTPISKQDMLKILAEQLYYQNVMWQELPIDTSKKILNETSLITAFADINNKSSSTITSYIRQQDLNKYENPNSIELALPYYTSDGYELGYINSDGADYLQIESMPPLIKVIQKQKAKSNNDAAKTKSQVSDSSKCGSKIPPSYIVSLTKWPQAFKCWLEEVSSNPFEFSISFVGSANDIAFGSGIAGIAEGLFGSGSELDTQLRQSGKKYGQEWRALVKGEDKNIPPSVSREIQSKLDNIVPEFSTKYPQVDSGLVITLHQKEDKGNFEIQLVTTGSNCLIGNGGNLCDGGIIQLQGGKDAVLNYTLDPNKKKGIGDMLFQIKMCSQDKCIYRNMLLTVQPGEIASLKFVTPLGSTVMPVAKGNTLPIVLQGFDANGNPISSSIFNFKVTASASGGLIYNNQLSQYFELNSFSDASFIYDSYSTNSTKEVISVSSSDGLSPVKQELQLSVIDPVLEIVPSSTTLTLPETTLALEKEQGGEFYVDPAKLIRLSVAINNNEPLYSVIQTRPLGGKFIVGRKQKKLVGLGSSAKLVDAFVPVDEFIHTGGLLELYLYPTMKAGDDSIEIKVGKTIKSQIISVLPAKAKKTVLHIEKEVIDSNGEAKGILSATDIRGNIIYADTKVLLGAYGNISIDGANNSGSAITIAGEREITIKAKQPGGQAYLFATLVGVSLDDQYPDFAPILVQNKSWPTKDLNIAYLNLYGSNRATQIDSSNNKEIGSFILQDSDKTLAITTQLLPLGSIYKSVLGLRSNGEIVSFEGGSLSGSFPVTEIGGVSGYVTDYGRLAFEGGLDNLKQKRTDAVDASRYQVVITTYGQGSEPVLVLQEIALHLDDEDKSIPSIQNSKDPSQDIGFGNYFKPMTNFAQGQSVGESSTNFASEYVINLGDPSFRAGEKRKLVDHTQYDAGQGRVIYSDPGKRIEQVMDIDRDKAGDKDILVNYSDGSMRLLLAVGNGNYEPIGDLAYIADGIKKLYVGDGDGDGRQDIFVHTLANQLRFYKNYDGKRIDVDGYPVCLGIDEEDNQNNDATNLDKVYQRFLSDPNKDKVTDIVVLDKNNTIQLFLGGGSSTLFEIGFGGGNYISRDKLSCDPGRKQRQKNKKSIVKSYAPQINNVEIRDESLVHWDGLKNTDIGVINPNANLEEPDKVDGSVTIPDMGKKPDKGKIKQLIGTIRDQVMDIANPKKWLEEYTSSLENTITLDSTYRPIYDNGTGEVVYKQLSTLLVNDKLDVYKKFIDLDGGRLENGDIVKVEISLKNKGASKATYIEKLSGPREVPLSGGRQVGFFAGSLNTDHTFVLAPGPSYVFMVDNISVGSNISFGYHVVFRSQQLVSIKHGEDHIAENGMGGSIGKLIPDRWADKALAQNDSDLPAWLEVTPLDGCAKFIWKIFAENVGGTVGNRFRESKIDLQKEIKEQQLKDEKEFEKGFSKGFDDLVSDTKAGVNEALMDSYIQETWKQKGILEEDSALQDIEYIADSIETLGNASLGTNLHVGLFGGDIDNFLDTKIGDLTKGLCEGFKVGEKNCSGVPILSSLPRNMAFLSPGDMQVMGCKIFKDKGIPAFSFPATSYAYAGLPGPAFQSFGIPGQKVPGEGFYGLGGGVPPYYSQFRLYLSPTLTAKLGIGLCFGPYAVGINFPKPFKDIAGNCITFAVDPGLGKCEVEQNKETGKYVLPKALKNFDTDSVCNDDIITKNGPLKLVETSINAADNRIESSQGQYGLVIKLGGYANLTNYNSISLTDFVDKTRIEGGNPLNLNVKSSLDGGLVSCIMNQFVDNQIRYIINNLTNLNLNIILPDRQGLIGQGQIIGNSISDLKGNGITSTIKSDASAAGSEISKVRSQSGDKQKISKKMDAVLGNPMDKLATLFSESELIHVSTRDVLIEIPRVYTNDLGKAKGIYSAWLERNKPIIEAWKNTGKDIMKQCDGIKDQFEREKCENSANTILQINNQLGQFDRSVRLNIETIGLYGELPKQVYELLHGYDRYVYDVFNLAYGTIDAITSWFSKIARGLDAWVSFIISLTSIIKSWQILIDFSVNRKEKCSKCTVDNYSAYSCSFRGFCPKLPVFAIPPFKIPSFTLDLSNLDLSTDIILPRFRFQPKRVGLFDNLLQFGLPDVPYPPGIHGSVDVKLPVIPIIPRPPDLSAISLPSFIPQIKFKGPTLPPAPRIPKIAPELAMAIDVASFIGRIFCIVKGGIGLVAEAGLKSRIEQMTQRTWNVEPFDSLKLLVPNTPLQTWNIFKPLKDQGGSFDMKFEAYIDVKSYFDQIYGLFDGVASLVNDTTRTVLRDSDQLPGVSKTSDRLKDQYNNADVLLEEYDEVNVNIPVKPLGYVDTLDYASVNNKIAGDLDYFVSQDDQINSQERKMLAHEIKGSYQLKTEVGLNASGLDAIKSEASEIMKKELDTNAKTKERIKQDYDGRLEHIVSSQYVSDDSINLSLKTNIATVDSQTLQYINSYNIADEYVSTQKQVVDGYTNALQQSDHVTLGMNKSDYDQSLDYLQRLQANIATTQLMRNETQNGEITTTTCIMCDKDAIEVDNGGTIISENNSIISKLDAKQQELGSTLLAQAGGNSDGGTTNIVGGLTTDPAANIRGYFVQGDDENYHNVIANIDKGEELSKVMFEKDLDKDGKRELISRDEHNVYIKSPKNVTQTKDASAQVDSYEFDSLEDIIDEVDSYGYANNLKIRSEVHMPKERKVAGQTYKSMTYSVDPQGGLENDIDGYIVRYVDDINAAYAKDGTYEYILILHTSRQGREIGTIDMDGKKLSTNDIRIEYSDMTDDSLGVVLANIPRRRYHTQIAKLHNREQFNPLLKFIPFVSKKPTVSIYKSSPWSSSETAGMQVIADSSSPYATVTLQREKSDKIVTQGDTMYGTIKTYYALTGVRFDDSKVVKSRILDANNKVLFSGNTDRIYLPGIYSDKPVTYSYQLVGEDAAGNVGIKNLSVILQLPKLSLDDVVVNDLGQSEAITNLDTDIDFGQVQFVRIRNGVESVLQSAFGSKNLFDAVTNQTQVIGGKFAFKQDIGFFDVNGKYLNVSITPEGQIINNNSSIKLTVDFRDGVPIISLMQNNQELYTIYLRAKEMDAKNGIQILNGEYDILALPKNSIQLGLFSNGYCIKPKQGVCEILVAQNGYMTVLKPYNRIFTADYGFKDGKVVYTLKKGKNSIAELQVKVEEVKK